MKYLGDSFSVHPGANKAYRDNYDAIFGKKKDKQSAYENDEMPPIPPPKDMKPEPVEEAPKKKRRRKKAKKND